MLLDQPEEGVAAAIDRLARAGEVAIDATVVDDAKDPAIYETLLYRAETSLAAGLARLLDAPAPALFVEADKAIAWYEREAGIALARQQAEAVKLALGAKVAVITGGPGVGKTTIVRGIVSILKRKGLTVALAAPTGRAAKRLTDATGAPASTLHRLLEWRPAGATFGRCPSNPLEADVLIVDEASMLDVRLGADLVAALASSARLVLVGDVDQLPSVGPGSVLGDVITSGAVPTVRLTEIFRQAAESLIVVNAHRIQEGAEPESGQPRPPIVSPIGATSFSSRRTTPRRPRRSSAIWWPSGCRAATDFRRRRSRCCRRCTGGSWAPATSIASCRRR